jgi:ribosomal protein L18E
MHADDVAHSMKIVSNILINYINSEVYENEIFMAGGNVFDTGNVFQPTIPSALDFEKGK